MACSLHCHDKHELVELYTKRNFQCDCGLKEGSAVCQLDPTKVKVARNTNQYNQNFAGLYCQCHRPYPDPENSLTDEMIQCVVCEDWHHSTHLNRKVPSSDSFDEMICGLCMDKHIFINDYAGLSISEVEDADGSAVLNVTSLDESALNGEEASSPGAKRIKLTDDACMRPKNVSSSSKGLATFWKDGWRKSLCKCSACMKLYEEENAKFLCDLEDTTQFYEEKGKGKERPSEYMASLEALSSLPRVNQIDAITSYNQMKEKLFEFLQTFVVNNQIVTESDIQRFFRNMKDSNEQAAVQPHFCR